MEERDRLKKQVKKIDEFLTRKLYKTKDKEIENLCKKLLNCLDSNYYTPRGTVVFRGWRSLTFKVDEID